jgi:hypothetical protein
VASTAPGQQAALASQSEAHALVLSANGTLALLDRASGGVRTIAGPTARCSPPFELVLLPSGLLVLRDSRGLVLWSSTSACGGGDSSCYSHALQNDGRLVVTDAGGAITYDSGDGASGGGSSSAAQGVLRQLVSGSTQPCIFNWGPMLPGTQLVSRSGRYALRISQQGAQLQLVDTGTGAQVWSPAGAVPGTPPARVCVIAQGALVLSDTGRQLWSSGPPRSLAAPPLVAQVTDAGRLEVLDGGCATVWASGPPQPSGTPQPSGAALQPSAAFRALQPPAKIARLPAPSAATRARPAGAPAAAPAPPPRPPAPGPPPAAAAKQPPPRPEPAKVSSNPPRARQSTAPRPPPKARRPNPPPKRPATARPNPPPRPPPKARPPPALRKAVKQGTGGAALVALPASSSSKRATTPAQAPLCRLADRAPCGGHLLCGADQACRQQGCCEGRLVCARASEWAWFCSSQQG